MHQLVSMLWLIALIMLSGVMADSTNRASHTYCVMVDSTIAVSVSLLTVPKMHRILRVQYKALKLVSHYVNVDNCSNRNVQSNLPLV